MFIGIVGYSQQVGDATMKTYADTYINTNNAGSITGAMMNQMLNYQISSKVNHDSATVVRIAATKDTLFITYWGFSEDTIPLAGVYWTLSGGKLYPTTAGNNVWLKDSVYMSGLPYKVCDTILGWDEDSIFKMVTPSNDTSNFDLLRAVLSPKSAIDTLDLDFVLADTLGIGLSSPDSLLDVYGGGNFKTDILVGGGVGSWSPTLTWNAVTAAATVVAKESVVNNVVKYTIDIRGTNNSGGALTTLNVTLPYTPRDINSYIAVSALIDEDSKVSYPLTFLGAIIDAEDNADGNRKIYTSGFSIANSADYMILMRGFYEITSK